MQLSHSVPSDKPARRAEHYAARLHALKFQSLIMRRAIDNPRHADRRELLATRLDLVDGQSADLAARLHSVTAEATP